MKTELVKWRNSLAVRIPAPAAERARLKEGDILEVHVTGEGKIELRLAAKASRLAKLAARISPQNRYPEISGGSERSKENVK